MTEIAAGEESETAGPEELKDALRREYRNALRACSPKERKLLLSLPEHGYQLWRAADRLGYSKRAVHLMVRRARFQRVREAALAILQAESLLDGHAVAMEYRRLAFANLKDFYDENGNLKSPNDWTEDMGAVVAERSFDEHGRPKIKLHDKRGALDAAAKLLRMMPNRIELTGANGEQLNPPQAVLNVVIAGKPEPTSGTG